MTPILTLVNLHKENRDCYGWEVIHVLHILGDGGMYCFVEDEDECQPLACAQGYLMSFTAGDTERILFGDHVGTLYEPVETHPIKLPTREEIQRSVPSRTMKDTSK